MAPAASAPAATMDDTDDGATASPPAMTCENAAGWRIGLFLRSRAVVARDNCPAASELGFRLRTGGAANTSCCAARARAPLAAEPSPPEPPPLASPAAPLVLGAAAAAAAAAPGARAPPMSRLADKSWTTSKCKRDFSRSARSNWRMRLRMTGVRMMSSTDGRSSGLACSMESINDLNS